ncbi:MAG: DUF1924 domain-containing protein [Betaproteobacteria bacterium]|nr:DUF1924 domain-containing protein [Betaproteobacteria bacterium]
MRHALFALLAIGMAATADAAESIASIQSAYATEAKREDSGFTAFSADRGRAFFAATHGKDWSCSTCHTANPGAPGRHTVTGKAIAPLAPSANPERFTDAAKADKWFRRNCTDVAGRACTAQEKGDILAWLLAVK